MLILLNVSVISFLIITTLEADSADDKLMILSLYFQENRLWYFRQSVSICVICQSLFSEKKKKIQIVVCWNVTQHAKR